MSSGPLIQLPLVDYYTVEGANVLVNGDFEGAAGPPPASWLAFQCVSSRQAGARTGGSGSYVGRAAWDSANAQGLLYQGARFVIGAPHRIYGWIQGINGAIPMFTDDTGVGFTGVAGAWQEFNRMVVPAGAQCRLQSLNLAATRYIEGDDLAIYPQYAVTRNLGSLGGVCTMGDGLTPATLPTMIGGGKRGMAFNGSQYLQKLGAIASSTFTMCFLVSRTAASNANLFDARTGGGTGFLWLTGTGGGALGASSGTIFIEDVVSSVLPFGVPTLVSVAGITIVSPTSLMIGQNSFFSGGWIGKMFGYELHPGALTPTQLRAVGERLRSQVNIY